ncbi:MAG: tetratricopeptide repeat protein [Bacteroidetes bacterium]|nr:tetratricopeptide repeat protein [Bacteroidota bacterium]
MNASRLYLIIGAVLVAAVVIVILLPEGEQAPQQAAAQGEMPPGHPSVEGDNAPSKSNVISSFMEEFDRLDKKIAAQPESDTSDVLVYARMCLDAHKAASAVPLLERYIKAAPKNTDVMLDLSVAYYETKDPKKAEEITMKVLLMDPKNTTAMYNLGALAASREDKATARKYWEKLIKEYPDSPNADRAKQFLEQL